MSPFRIPLALAMTAVLAMPVSQASSSEPADPLLLTDGQVFSVAVSQGQVYFTTYRNNAMQLVLRSVTRPTGSLQLGPEQVIATVYNNAIAASSGRLVFDGRARTYTGQIKVMGNNAVLGREASGNRALVQDWNGPLLEQTSYADLYDAKTGTVRNEGAVSPDLPQPSPVWPQGPQDLFGNYFLRARTDGSVIRRDWQLGKQITVRPAGGAIRAVAIHGSWVAWVTGTPDGPLDAVHHELAESDCPQTLTARNLVTGTTRSVQTCGTHGLDMSGDALAFDTVVSSGRELRTMRLSTGMITIVGALTPYRDWGMGPDKYGSEPRHFDLDDELITWIDQDSHGRLAALAPSIDAPRYLGNAIAPASFATRWSIAVPVSKALPVCTVTIYRGTTKVRVLGCANRIGMVSVVWDGRTGGGTLLPAGTYSYRISGRDDDGYWLRHYDGTLRTIGGTITKTS